MIPVLAHHRVDVCLECLCGQTERPLASECILVLRSGLPWVSFRCTDGRPMALPLNDRTLALMLTTPAVRSPDFMDWCDNRKAAL